jgi:hypothetical protein
LFGVFALFFSDKINIVCKKVKLGLKNKLLSKEIIHPILGKELFLLKIKIEQANLHNFLKMFPINSGK